MSVSRSQRKDREKNNKSEHAPDAILVHESAQRDMCETSDGRVYLKIALKRQLVCSVNCTD